MAKPIKGIINSIQPAKEGKGDWTHYDVTIDGSKYSINVNTSKHEAPVSGDNVILWEAKFDTYNYGGKVDPEQEAKFAKGGSSNASSTSYKSGAMSSTGYWEAKTEYEVNVKDPSLRFQGIFGKVVDIYSAAISAEMTMQDANIWLEKAFTKTNEMTERFCENTGKFCSPDCREECNTPNASKSTKKAAADVGF